MTELQENYYIDTSKIQNDIDNIIKREFPTYWKKVSKLPFNKRKNVQILSQDEINNLMMLWKNHKDISARNRLIYSQLKLVYHYAMEFHFQNNATNLSPKDIIGFAYEILLDIIDKYNPYANKSEEEIKNGDVNKLPSYIQTWIKHYLHHKIKDYGLDIRIPENKISDLMLQKRYFTNFEQRFGRNPFDGESFEIFDKNKKTRVNILKKITFNILDEEILIYTKSNSNQWVLEKKIKYSDTSLNIISGNTSISNDDDDDTELFDFIEGDLDTSFEIGEDIFYNQLKSVLKTLNKRELKSINLEYVQKETLKDIPSFLEPQTAKEHQTLSKTSLNNIYIYMKDSFGKVYDLKYEIVSNYHLQSQIIGEQNKDISNQTFITKHTNATSDIFEFSIENLVDIQVKHETYKGIENVQFKYDGLKLTFNVEYCYGAIFTAQTFNNKKEKILDKLRIEAKKLKKYRQ